MGIEFSRSYKASGGKCYATLKEAQEAELEGILRRHVGNLENVSVESVVKHLLANVEEVLNVLTITDSSRPKARGMKKPRKPKANVTPQPDAQAAA